MFKRFSVGLILLLISSAARGDNWPQFLGPNRNGALSDPSFVQSWIRGGIKEQWRISVGEGYSGIVTKNGRIFTMDRQGKEEFVVCFDAANGKQVWRYKMGPSPDDVYGGLGPRVTPSVDGELLFTVSARGDLLALKSETGELRWKRTLAADHGWRPPAEGTASSPLVIGEQIYLINGGTEGRAAAAFDRGSGKTLWTSLNDRPSYASAVEWSFKGVRQILFLTGANLFSVEAESGKLLWKYPWATYDYVNAATPLLIPPDRVFISSGYDQGAAMLRLAQTKNGTMQIQELWRNREMKNHFNNSVYSNGVLVGFDNAIFKAVDANTGQTLWRESGLGKGSVILSGSYLIIVSEDGDLMAAKASREKFQVQKRMTVLDGRCWTPPSLAGDRLYLRSTNELVCLVTTTPSKR